LYDGKGAKMIAYKLLNLDLTTYKGCQWRIGEKKQTKGAGLLCGPGWLHGYEHAEIAHFLNPIHANFKNPVLYKVKVGGTQLRDGNAKSGWTQMTLMEEVALRPPTIRQYVRFAIASALYVCKEPKFVYWATAWLRGKDRAAEAAVEVVAGAAWAAAAAAVAAAETAAVAAEAAEAAAVAADVAETAAEAADVGKRGNLLLECALFARSKKTYPQWLERR
jgi:hypothetical protein